MFENLSILKNIELFQSKALWEIKWYAFNAQ